jgi:hypothetical protein
MKYGIHILRKFISLENLNVKIKILPEILNEDGFIELLCTLINHQHLDIQVTYNF